MAALALTCDVSDRHQVAELIRSVHTDLGPIDVLINNAGMVDVGPVGVMTRNVSLGASLTPALEARDLASFTHAVGAISRQAISCPVCSWSPSVAAAAATSGRVAVR